MKCIDEEIPFDLPFGWEWCRLKNIGVTETGTTPTKSHPEYFGNTIPFYGPGNIQDNKISSVTQGISEQGLPFSRIVPPHTILQVCIGGSIGKAAIVDSECSFNQQINSITVHNGINTLYAFYVLISEFFKQQIVDKSTGTATPIINRSNWENLLIPIPPNAEQRQIIAKLAELLPIVEKYDKSQHELDVLNVSVKEQLQKSILQEAIQGKLVPQIAEESTAQELLEQIRQEKQKLVKEGKLKKSALNDSVVYKGDDNKYYEQIGGKVVDITDDIPFEVPSNWIWIRLKDLCSIRTGATFKKEEASTENKGIRVLRGGNIQRFQLYTKPDDLFISEEKVKYDILLKQNDIITPAVTSLENIGKMARVEIDMPDTTVGGFVFIIRPFWKNDYVSKYLLAFMSSPAAVDYMQSITNKSGQAFYNIGKERLATTLVPLPPFAEQERICCRISELFAKIRG